MTRIENLIERCQTKINSIREEHPDCCEDSMKGLIMDYIDDQFSGADDIIDEVFAELEF